jgi:hypothetical protein
MTTQAPTMEQQSAAGIRSSRCASGGQGIAAIFERM